VEDEDEVLEVLEVEEVLHFKEITVQMVT